MAIEDNALQRKLKFKITTKGLREDSGEKTGEKIIRFIVKSGHRLQGSDNEHSGQNVSVKPFVPAMTNKRSAETSLAGQKEKVRRIDRKLKLQCGNILKELMSHCSGWVFNEPVDPVKWKIPDYFSIITNPMDLGTIKSKLERNMYFSPEEFAADVRLTFSNAMRYNPPGDEVHNLAKLFDGSFIKKWKILEAKLERERVTVLNDFVQISQPIVEQGCQGTKQVGIKRTPVLNNHDTCTTTSLEGMPKLSMSFEEKQKLRSKLVEVLRGKIHEKLRTVFQNFGLNGLKEERLVGYIDAADDDTLRKLKREIDISFDARAEKVKPLKMAEKDSRILGKTIQKGTENHSRSCSFANQIQIGTTARCSSCGELICHCRDKNVFTQTYSSDVSSDRSSEFDHCDNSKLDFVVNHPLTSNASRSGADSDGPGVVLDGEKSLSTSATTASDEGWASFNVPLSPKKALRVAMLKSRFARTIYKATHQGENSDPIMMEQERERLEREQLEEKARIEREIKAAEEALRIRAQVEREREREAARLALLKMERTVDIDENLGILKDLEMMCCSPAGVENPLKRLGLYFKEDDYLEEDEDAILSVVEEGEIL